MRSYVLVRRIVTHNKLSKSRYELEMSGNVFLNPNPSCSQLFIPSTEWFIPVHSCSFLVQLTGSTRFYSHYLPSPIGYSHSLPLPLQYYYLIAPVAVFHGHRKTNNM